MVLSSRSFLWLAVPVLLLAGAAGQPAHAHPGIDEQLEEVTARLAATPDDARLFLRRGELYRLHGDPKAARADFDRARSLDPELVIVEFCLGRLLLEDGKPQAALAHLDTFLARRPDDADGRATRGRALAALGRHAEAAADFDRAIGKPRGEAPLPEYYLERARAYAAAGPEYVERALQGLDEGLERLGEPVTLQLFAIELEMQRGAHDAALTRVDRIAAQSARDEPWLMRRGAILEIAGRREEAMQAYRATIASIDSLPAGRRANRAVRRLQDEAASALERLEHAVAEP